MEKDIWHTVPGLLLLLPIVILGNCWQSFSTVGAGLLALLVTWGVGYIWHQGYRVWFEWWLGGDGFARNDRRVLRVLLAARPDLVSVDDRQYTREHYWQAFLAWEHVFYTADWPRFVQHNKEQWHYIFAYRSTASAAFASAAVCLPWVIKNVAYAEVCLLIAGLFIVSILFTWKARQTYRSLNLQEEMAVRKEGSNPASGAPDFGRALAFSSQISLPTERFCIRCPALNPCCRFVIGLVLVLLVGIGLGCAALKLSPRYSDKTCTTSLVIRDLGQPAPSLANSP
ncbi:MAG: hypothetical protein HY268_22410 [Deltaproteobacteria bacterium]|nr:hypothetical protein [Deltaproteobacteria bacterium]